MDTRLDGGDFAVGANGLPGSVGGREELLQRALIRLTVPRGSFSYDPELGGRLHTLVLSGADLSARARELVEEALAAMPGVSVEQVACTPLGGGRARLAAELSTSFGPDVVSLELTGQEG
ncbi:histidine kinase [Faecalispora sporosphaeroides]|uniref:Histidine kinase n=1 Tax=Faecalispora sporosphaeroides TaxID=1549 RepID=A0A928KRL4_9FIRM|nr:histidine kinase [Faecalispora sporosphaeroides]MBE6833438.1 histidine kinase [Faecalispora sporosphaeroides]